MESAAHKCTKSLLISLGDTQKERERETEGGREGEVFQGKMTYVMIMQMYMWRVGRARKPQI